MRRLAAALLLLWGQAGSAASLFDELGGREHIAAFTADFVERTTHDPRIAQFFAQTDHPRIASRLTDLFCHLAGEDRPYRGVNLKNAHAGMGISEADFNALTEDLQEAMEANGVSFAAESRLVALLAPLKRDIVER
jgi:hemoglobin